MGPEYKWVPNESGSSGAMYETTCEGSQELRIFIDSLEYIKSKDTKTIEAVISSLTEELLRRKDANPVQQD